MKSYISIALIAFSLVAVTSCKRSHTCSCYSPDLNKKSPDFEIKGSKKDAKAECEAEPLTGAYIGTDYQCNLK